MLRTTTWAVLVIPVIRAEPAVTSTHGIGPLPAVGLVTFSVIARFRGPAANSSAEPLLGGIARCSVKVRRPGIHTNPRDIAAAPTATDSASGEGFINLAITTAARHEPARPNATSLMRSAEFVVVETPAAAVVRMVRTSRVARPANGAVNKERLRWS